MSQARIIPPHNYGGGINPFKHYIQKICIQTYSAKVISQKENNPNQKKEGIKNNYK